MQGFVYSFREGISGLRRAKLSCLLSIITITISLFLIGGILVIALNMHQILSSIRARMELEVFLDNSISGEKIRALQQQIASIEGVEKTEFISKEQAAEYFLSEFKQDITEILDANPLPASFRIKFSQSHQTAEGADSILNSIEGLPGIDEIVYRSDFIRLLDKYVSIAYLVLIGVGCIVCFSSIFFVYNNIRLVIFSKRQLIETMKLVGATPGFIRFPFIVEGVFQAFFGVLFSYGALLGINTMLKTQNVLIDFPKVQIFGLLALLSILIGVFGSILSANRFLKY